MTVDADSLGAQGEAAWARFARRIGQLQGFGYIVLFVSDPALLARFRSRLSAWMARRSWPWLQLAEADPDGFAERSIGQLFDGLAAAPAPRLIWLEACRGAGQAAWEQARGELLSRLNERRGRLESELAGALVLLLPEGAQRAAAGLAPDLWHVRSLGMSLAGAAEPSADAAVELTQQPAEAARGRPAQDASAEATWATAWWQRWQRMLAGRAIDSIPIEDEGLLAFNVWDGLKSQGILLRQGHLADAQLLADQLVRLARRRAAQGAGLLDVATSRELSAALDALGDSLQMAGRPQEAVPVYEECLAICRELAQRLGGTSMVLRDLAIALNNIGRVAQALGDWRRAGAAYEESLALHRTLATRLGETPEALRELSLALNNAGRAAQAQGDWGRAGAMYDESLALSQALLQPLGETPEALRELALALHNAGRAAQVQGDWQRARALFEEGLALNRTLVYRLGETPEVLRELCLALNNVGRAAQAQGDWDRAGAVYEESLALLQTQARRGGETPEALRELSNALDNIGRVAEAQGDWARGAEAYEEALTLRRALVERLGETPEVLRDLSLSLDKVGQGAQAQGDRSRAAEAYEEGLDLRRKLAQRLGGTPMVLRELAIALHNIGRVAQSQGDWRRAAAAYEERLALSRAQIAQQGALPELQADLAATLLDAAALAGARAEAYRAEAGQILAALRHRFPEVERYEQLQQRLTEPAAVPPARAASPDTPPHQPQAGSSST